MSASSFEQTDLSGGVGPDIHAALKACGYFELLDDRLCPADPGHAPVPCGHSFANTIKILREMAIELYDLERVILFLRGRGARCDCDVLLKVAESSRFRSECAKAGMAPAHEPRHLDESA